MFTESVGIGCSFPACCGGLAKYQTCLIFHQPSMILYPGAAQLWLCSLGNRPLMELYSLSVTLSVLSYTAAILS